MFVKFKSRQLSLTVQASKNGAMPNAKRCLFTFTSASLTRNSKFANAKERDKNLFALCPRSDCFPPNEFILPSGLHWS